jgi:hypothetical protein
MKQGPEYTLKEAPQNEGKMPEIPEITQQFEILNAKSVNQEA